MIDSLVSNTLGRLAGGLLSNFASSYTGIAILVAAFGLMFYPIAARIYKTSKFLAAGLALLVVAGVIYRPELPALPAAAPPIAAAPVAPSNSILDTYNTTVNSFFDSITPSKPRLPVVDIGPLMPPVSTTPSSSMLDTLKKNVASFFPPTQSTSEIPTPFPAMERTVAGSTPSAGVNELGPASFYPNGALRIGVFSGLMCPRCDNYKYGDGNGDPYNRCHDCNTPYSDIQGVRAWEAFQKRGHQDAYNVKCTGCGEEQAAAWNQPWSYTCTKCNRTGKLIEALQWFKKMHRDDPTLLPAPAR